MGGNGAAKVFTAKELSRFTGGAPLSLTRIAEVQAAAKVKKEPGRRSRAQATRRWMPRAHQMKEDEAKEKDDVFVDPSVPIYLAVLGVSSITKGKEYYGPKAGGYSGFAGRGGSRAFVTGKFDDVGLIDDVADMTDEQIFSIFEWLDFYTRRRNAFLLVTWKACTLTQRARKQNTTWPWCHVWMHYGSAGSRRRIRKGIPSCNTRWASGEGTRIWCEGGGCHASGI